MDLRKLLQGPGSCSFLLALVAVMVQLALSSGLAYTDSGVLSSPPECRRNEFSTEVNGTTICRECSSCQPGEGVWRECSATSDTVCIACKAGKRFSMEIRGMMKCIRCIRCHGHQRVKKECTPTTDTVCGACREGYYWDDIWQECRRCVACNADMMSQGIMYEQKECSNNQQELFCGVSSDYNYIQEEPTSYGEETGEDDVIDAVPDFSNTSKQAIETEKYTSPEVLRSSDVKSLKLYFTGSVVCSALSGVFMMITIIACCLSLRRCRRKGRRSIYNPVHSSDRVPVESSQS